MTLVVLLKQAVVSLLLQSLEFLVHLLSFLLGDPREILGNSSGLGSCWAFGLSFHNVDFLLPSTLCFSWVCQAKLQQTSSLTWCHLLASYSWAPLPICRQALLEQFLGKKPWGKNCCRFFLFFLLAHFFRRLQKEKVQKSSFVNFPFLLFLKGIHLKFIFQYI